MNHKIDMTIEVAQHNGPLVRWPLRLIPAVVLPMTVVCAAIGVCGGATQLYWMVVPFSWFKISWVTSHGPLMVNGFLGTVIGVKKAVDLRNDWTFLSPLLTLAGGLMLISGVSSQVPKLHFVFGSAWLCAITAIAFFRQRSIARLLLLDGCALWSCGNVLWLLGWPIHRLVPWWIGFLLCTIVSKCVSRSRSVGFTLWQRWLAFFATLVFSVGVVASAPLQLWGEQTAALGMIALAVCVLLGTATGIDRHQVLPRFTAACSASGSGWLALAGTGLLIHTPLPAYGRVYDAILHAFFLGFVGPMIVTEILIISMSLATGPLRSCRSYYLVLLLFHATLAGRIAGDLRPSDKLNGWCGTVNALLIALFVLYVLVAGVRTARRRRATKEPD